MNYSVLPPEINSLRMFTGAGSAPMLAATAAGRWAKKGANHFDVRLADQALALGGGGGGQLWG